VFANATRTEAGAATRTENITVGAVSAAIIGTPTATWIDGHNTRINVTTNAYTEAVWAVMPGTGQRVRLTRTNPATTGNRTWQVDAHDTITTGNIVIGVSNQDATNLNALTAQDTRTITRGVSGVTGAVHAVTHWNPNNTVGRRNQVVEFSVRTALHVDRLEVSSAHGLFWVEANSPRIASVTATERIWYIEMRISPGTPLHQQFTVTITAFQGGNVVGTATTPPTTVIE
jgi:hypothetical protein